MLSCYLRFEIRPFALLPTTWLPFSFLLSLFIQQPLFLTHVLLKHVQQQQQKLFNRFRWCSLTLGRRYIIMAKIFEIFYQQFNFPSYFIITVSIIIVVLIINSCFYVSVIFYPCLFILSILLLLFSLFLVLGILPLSLCSYMFY